MTEQDNNSRRKHDPFFRWLFAEPYHTKTLLELAGKVNRDVADFLATVNPDTLVRIPDSFSEVEDTGEGDLAFRVSVVTGAPVLVGVLLEHKSGRDADVFNQIARYARSVMKIHGGNPMFDGLPTMAIIFYNGRENWNPLKKLEEGYPEYYRGKALPFNCSFVNMHDIPDSDCLACEDSAAGMGIVAMKHAFNKERLLALLPQFNPALRKMPQHEAACLLHKINVYLKEYVDEDLLKELDMAFVSVGQKYGFVSAGDVFRQRLADARAETEAERQRADKAREDERKDAVAVLQDMGLTPEQVAEFKAKLEAKQKQ